MENGILFIDNHITNEYVKKGVQKMCLAIPSKIIRVEGSQATVDVYGAQREISLLVLDEDLNIGDYVIVHAGFAIQKIKEDVAKETIGYFNQYLEAMAEEGELAQPVKKARKRTKKKN